jgi:dTDP-4-amino-4,6-dideoxygalactose transaminase
MTRVYLSPPDVGPAEAEALQRALDGGWVAPLGPEVDAFEAELAQIAGRRYACALSSGTAALHLALINAGVGPGDEVLVSSLTFAATANAVRYVGAEPVFVDSEEASWNMDPKLLAEALEETSHRYKAVVVVDLYGQCASYERIAGACAAAGTTLISDAAESIGATYQDRPSGSFGDSAILSFNGNKIVTTSGGGALVTDDEEDDRQARFLATQARDPAPHYEHSQLGYNYRLSNLLAALGRAQLSDLPRRVARRRDHNQFYREGLGDLPGITFMPEAQGCRSTFWLTALLVDFTEAGVTRDDLRLHLETLDIESRPVWKPMHLQPLYRGSRVVGGKVAEQLFELGLCLPSGSNLSDHDRSRVVEAIRDRMGG